MYYKLGEPLRQNGIPGVVIPIQWSEEEDPFTPILNSSLIVSAIVQNSELVIDEADLDNQIDRMEQDLLVQRAAVAKSINIQKRFKGVHPTKRTKTLKDKTDVSV